MSDNAAVAPVPTRASKNAIHTFAEEVARRLGFKPGNLLEPVVANLGGNIVVQSPFLLKDDPPSIIVKSRRDFTIHLPPTTSPRRNRLTICHELGHLFLHYPMVQKGNPGAQMVATRWVDEGDPQQQRAEWEANWFAASFLMPASLFAERSAIRGNDIAATADEFDVSIQAATLRAEALGCSIAV